MCQVPILCSDALILRVNFLSQLSLIFSWMLISVRATSLPEKHWTSEQKASELQSLSSKEIPWLPCNVPCPHLLSIWFPQPTRMGKEGLRQANRFPVTIFPRTVSLALRVWSKRSYLKVFLQQSPLPQGSVNKQMNGVSLAIKWLRFHTSNAECSIPGWGTKILHAAWHK